jgi:transposase-like protein
MIPTSDLNTQAPVAPLCPFCRSADISTNGKVESDASYWRCDKCGQIWNPTRLVVKRPARVW